MPPVAIKKETTDEDGKPTRRGKTGEWHARSVGASIKNPAHMGMRRSVALRKGSEYGKAVHAAGGR